MLMFALLPVALIAIGYFYVTGGAVMPTADAWPHRMKPRRQLAYTVANAASSVGISVGPYLRTRSEQINHAIVME